jgi:transcriptional regulator with XRE-family HTH domain
LSNITGIDIATLSRIENNKLEPSIKQIKAIAQALKLEVANLKKRLKFIKENYLQNQL